MRSAAVLVIVTSLFLACTLTEKGKEPEKSLPWRLVSSAAGEIPPPGSSAQQTASLVLDVDNDSLNDFVIGCRQGSPSLVWYRRTAQGWKRLVIDPEVLPVEAGGAYCDIDSDGDRDIVMGADFSGDRVWWWENPYPDYDPDKPWVRREIKSGGASKHHDQMFGDFDGDGRPELVFWNQGRRGLFLAEIPEDPHGTEPWPLEIIYTWQPLPEDDLPVWQRDNEHEGLAAADIDHDDVPDIIGGGRWFRHLGGHRFEVNEIDPDQHFSRAAAGQLVEGGAPEVVFVIGDGSGRARWYEWTNGRWLGRDLLGHDLDHAHSLQIADLDRDGHQDVFLAEMRLDGVNPDAKIYVLAGDGRGHFADQVIAEGFGNHESRAADLDGDGDLDILGKPYNWQTPRLDLWINGGEGFNARPGVPFEHVIIDENGPADPHVKSTGDIDGDGAADPVAASSAGGPLVWYRSPDWPRYEIAPSGRWSCDAELADVDGDGDNDIVICEYYSLKRLEWYENPLPASRPDSGAWTLHVIGPGRAHDLEVADLDGDGDPDVAVRGQSGFGANEGNRVVLWFQQSPDYWSQAEIACPHGEGLALADIDRDGRPDVVTGGLWYANPGRAGGEWKGHKFADFNQDAVVKTGDVNLDGRPDVVLSEAESSGPVCWFANSAGTAEGAWPRHVICDTLEKGHGLAVGDVDNDGDPDVAAAEMHQSEDPDRVLVFLNLGNGNSWQEQALSRTGSHAIRLADLDGDGDLDLFGANWKSVAQDSLAYIEVWRNVSGGANTLPLSNWRRHVIDPDRPSRAVFIQAGDLNGDGLPDVAAGGWWYPNPGKPAGKWARRSFGGRFNNLAVLHDFDHDGRLDALATTGKGAEPSAEFLWAHNLGEGRFEILGNIPPADGDFLQGVAVAQASRGGPSAVALSWHGAGKGIQAFILPGDPVRERWSWAKATDFSQDEQISAGDIDDDGDTDLLLGTWWLENRSGEVELHELFHTADSPDRNRLADIDGDGRLDAVVGYEAINRPGKLAWYGNSLPAGGEWAEHVIATVTGPMSLDVVDMDWDGDPDVVVGEHDYEHPEGARLLVFRNLDGRGGQWRCYVVYTGDEHHDGAVTVDVDQDGDLDVVSIGWSHPRVVLYENLAVEAGGRPLGRANH